MPLSSGECIHHDRYRIEVLLGKGGMGAVYLAYDTSLNIKVALKENLELSPEAQKQFFYEAHLLASLSHPNLPRVIDYFTIPEQGQYLVMDYVEGEDLYSQLTRSGPLPEQQVLNWIFQVCDALVYLHNQPSPIIHRDIKPANIKIRPDGRAVLVDFGISKVFDPQRKTTTGARALTPGYSPPEQYGEGTTDARSDIYAVGATLYHLLTGSKPPDSILRIVNNISITPPSQINRQISPWVEKAILKSLDIGTDSRFQKISELRAALERGAAVAPSRPAPPEPFPASVDKRSLSGKPFVSSFWPVLIGCLGLLLIVGIGAIAGIILLRGAPGLKKGFPAAGLLSATSTHTQAANMAPTQVRTIPPSEIAVVPDPTQTLAPSPSLTPTSSTTPTSSPKTPRMFNFMACPDECNGTNATRTFEEKEKSIYAEWQYENIPPGAAYSRSWTNRGEVWVRYECSWMEGETGTSKVRLRELDNGLRSGTWILTIILNGQILLEEEMMVEGTWDVWEPPEDIVRYTCFETPAPTSTGRPTKTLTPTATGKSSSPPTPAP